MFLTCPSLRVAVESAAAVTLLLENAAKASLVVMFASTDLCYAKILNLGDIANSAFFFGTH